MLKKALYLLFTAILILTACYCNAGAETEYSWYCIRTKNNKMPPCPSEMSFIEQNGGYYIDKKQNDDSIDKVVYLTFDAGYENGNVEKILNELNENGVKAAFFILGNIVTSNTQLVERMANEGHIVCNHTNHHHDMSKVTDRDEFCKELKSLEELYKKSTGRELSKYYRPPEGRFTAQNLKFADEMGYKTIFWSFAYADWDNNKQPTNEYAMKKIFDNIHNGAVILLHPTSKTNADILGTVIKRLKADGYRFGTLDELCQCPHSGELLE